MNDIDLQHPAIVNITESLERIAAALEELVDMTRADMASKSFYHIEPDTRHRKGRRTA